MVSSYEEHMGTPMDVIDHPARTSHAATLQYAGDVVHFPIDKDKPEVTIKTKGIKGLKGGYGRIPRNIHEPANDN